LSAADVVYSFRRLMGRQDLQIRNYLSDVESVDALDAATLRVRTRLPTRLLVNRLAYVLIVPDGRDDEALRGSVDGTGPFRLSAFVPGEKLALSRNEGHWRKRAAVSEAEFVLGRTPEQALEGLSAGRFQLVKADSRKLDAALGGSARFRVLRRDNVFVKYLAYDLARDKTPFCDARRNPFKDLRVRRALDLALDRHRLAQELWNYAAPATQPVPRFILGFDPSIRETAHDKEQARELLRAAGFPQGFGVVLHARRIVGEAARLVAEDLRAVGIRATPEVLPDADFFRLVGRGGASLWVNRFGCLTGDATEFLYDVVHSRDAERRLGAMNYGGHSDPALDADVERIASLDHVEQRRTAIQAAMRRTMEKLVVVPLYDDQDVYALDVALSWEPRNDSFIDLSSVAPRP
jgi:peptide/nickel transport system substrate-binding protein